MDNIIEDVNLNYSTYGDGKAIIEITNIGFEPLLTEEEYKIYKEIGEWKYKKNGTERGLSFINNKLIYNDDSCYCSWLKRHKAELETILSECKKNEKELEEQFRELLKSNTNILRKVYPDREFKSEEQFRNISIFESDLNRCFGCTDMTHSDDIISVVTYYTEIFESIMMNGFDYLGKHFVFFTAGAGQTRCKKSTFVNEELLNKNFNRLFCGLSREDINKLGGMNTNKYLAYTSLCQTNSEIWRGFNIDNAEGVTGSCTRIKTSEHCYLFECGMIQGKHTVLENYHANMKYIQKIKPQEVEYIIIGHLHADHIGMIPTLYARGKCNAKIIVPTDYDTVIKLRLISFTVDYNDTSKIDVTFSDAIRVHDIYEDASSIQVQANSAAMSFQFNKDQYDKSSKQSNWVAEMRKYGLDVAAVQIHNAKNQSQIWDKTGMTFKMWNDERNDFDPEQIKIINNMMVFSDDGFKTSKMAIGKIPIDKNGNYAYGINAEVLMSKLVMSENLWIENDSGTYKFNDSGFIASSEKNSVKIQPNQSGELFSIYKGSNKQFYVDADGNVHFAGDLSGATGTFSGLVSGGSINIGNATKVIALAKALQDKIGTIDNKVDQNYVVNNLTTTEQGFVLDGRQGKALQDQITNLNGSMLKRDIYLNGDGELGADYYLKPWLV